MLSLRIDGLTFRGEANEKAPAPFSGAGADSVDSSSSDRGPAARNKEQYADNQNPERKHARRDHRRDEEAPRSRHAELRGGHHRELVYARLAQCVK